MLRVDGPAQLQKRLTVLHQVAADLQRQKKYDRLVKVYGAIRRVYEDASRYIEQLEKLKRLTT